MDLPSTFATLKLQFGHDCRNVGCNLPGCKLCRNNPKRRCQTHFREKYIDNVNRVFTAWCEAPILVRIVDSVTEEEFLEDEDSPSRIQGARLQLCLLEGILYEQKESEVGAEDISEQDYAAMMLLDNTNSSKAEPLLVPGKGCPGEHTVHHMLIVPMQAEGTPILVRSSRSSQSAQGGRVKPFRLFARAVWEDGRPVPFILPDVSEPFVVTTRRTQGAEKALIPKWDDSVSKLPGVGKETFSKLKDLQTAGLTTPLKNYRIQTVGQLFQLIDKADSALLQDLGRTLGLKADKVAELQQNARTVARKDTRKRVWGSPDFPSDRLLYPCQDGAVNLLQQHIEVMRDTDDGAEIIDTADLPEEDLLRVIEMRQLAFASWWAPGHPGWGIIDEVDPPSEGSSEFAAPDAVPTASLRQQMDRQCKQRRFQDLEDEAFPDPVEAEAQPVYRSSVAYPGVKQEPSADALSHFNSVSVPGSEHFMCMPRRSVFDIEAFPENGAEMDPLMVAAREINPNAQDISQAHSSEPLLDQPVGLAYISSGPLFERNGPIRFKRSVSGNRYKPMPQDAAAAAAPPNVSVATGGAFPNIDGSAHPGQAYVQQPVGVFSGLPPRPSRELRTQTSLDKVASWQQTRPLSSSNLGERLSQSYLFSLMNEPFGPEYDHGEHDGDLGGLHLERSSQAFMEKFA